MIKEDQKIRKIIKVRKIRFTCKEKSRDGISKQKKFSVVLLN